MNKSKYTITDSPFHYRSKVSYSLMKGKCLLEKVTHNTGCQYLFELFAKAVAGEDTRTMKPVLVDLQARNSESEITENVVLSWPSVLGKRIAITGRQYTILPDGSWGTVLTISIPWTASLAQNTSGYEKEYALCLYSQSGKMLAYFIISNDTISKFIQSGSGSSIVVEWVMTIANV